MAASLHRDSEKVAAWPLQRADEPFAEHRLSHRIMRPDVDHRQPVNRIGPYEVVGRLGVGGMGEVFRARDLRLGRDIGIKVLPASIALDEQFEPVGSSRTIRVNVRVIAATNRDLDQAVRAGEIQGRSPLSLERLPDLRPAPARARSDISLLVGFFTASLARKLGNP
jgi:serine/threonine protein kinase